MAKDFSEEPSVKTALYRHFDASGALLYVGVSLSAVTRLSQHKAGSPWSDDVARVEIEWFPSKATARAAERDAIKSEAPQHNYMHNGGGRWVLGQQLSESPASAIIKKLGGVAKTAALCGRTESWVYKWTYPKEKSGRGGVIPHEDALRILEASKRGECVPIDASEFFFPDAEFGGVLTAAR